MRYRWAEKLCRIMWEVHQVELQRCIHLLSDPACPSRVPRAPLLSLLPFPTYSLDGLEAR